MHPLAEHSVLPRLSRFTCFLLGLFLSIVMSYHNTLFLNKIKKPENRFRDNQKNIWFKMYRSSTRYKVSYV